MKIMNANRLNDMDVLNMKQQAKLASSMQKIGKTKRKIEVHLSKSSQKYLDQVIIELKKQMDANTSSALPNILSFFNYLQKQVHVEKKAKREKLKSFKLSYEEQDFLVLQIKSMIKEVERQKDNLKFYNLIKKLIFSSVKAQNELLLKELTNKK